MEERGDTGCMRRGWGVAVPVLLCAFSPSDPGAPVCRTGVQTQLLS